MCVFSYRVNQWIWLNAAVQIMAHPPLVVADVLAKSNTATATEKVDIGGVVWKWTQVHPGSLILQTQATVENSWALPDMIWQSRLRTLWQTPWECHTNKYDVCHIIMGSRYSAVDIATRYGLDGPGIESRCRWDILNLSRPALRPIQPPIQWVPDLSWGQSGWGLALTTHPHLAPRLKKE
jgi:hypothetical protein